MNDVKMFKNKKNPNWQVKNIQRVQLGSITGPLVCLLIHYQDVVSALGSDSLPPLWGEN